MALAMGLERHINQVLANVRVTEVTLMSRLRLVVLGLLAVLAVSAVGASSAFAASPEYHGFTGTETISGSGGAQLFESTVATQKILIKCEKNKGTGSLTATTGAGSGELTFEGCVLWLVNGTTHEATSAAATCTVANAIAKISAQLGKENTLETLKGSGEAGLFTEIKITGASCVAKGTFKVTGEVVCSGPEGEVALAVHVLNCNAANSALKLAAESARLTGSLNVELSGANKGKAWWGE